MGDNAKVEFAVEMSCNGCANSIKKALKEVEGIHSVEVNLKKEQVLVDTNLPFWKVKELIETTGKKAVLIGYGSTLQGKPNNLGAAVSIIEVGHNLVKGVIRLVQTSEHSCLIEGTIDGLPPGKHGLFVHELGDISDGCQSCGEVLENVGPMTRKLLGAVGDITAQPDGRSEFRMNSKDMHVWDLIGRSIVVHEEDTQTLKEGGKEKRLACGIVARSAGLFENAKKICACDGVTIWDERNVPLAGEGRQSKI